MFIYKRELDHPPKGYKSKCNCENGINEFLGDSDSITGEEFIKIAFDNYTGKNLDGIIWKNSFIIKDISPESVGDDAYKIFSNYYKLVDCGYHFYYVKNLTRCNYLYLAKNCTDCYYGIKLFNCKNCILCEGLMNKEYYICNNPVTKEEYEIVRSNIDKLPKGWIRDTSNLTKILLKGSKFSPDVGGYTVNALNNFRLLNGNGNINCSLTLDGVCS